MGRVTRAVLVSFLCVLPHLATLALQGPFDPAIFSDWDEPYYLPLAFEAARIPANALISMRQGNIALFSYPGMELPHNVLDFLVGIPADLSGLTPVYLGVLLDFSCVISGYLLLSRLIDLMWGRSLTSELGAFVGLKLPWLFSVEEMLQIRLPLGGQQLQTWAHSFFPSQPCFRAVYTQIGFVLFIATGCLFYELLSGARDKRSKRRCLVALAFLSAIQLYVYFFSWLVTICMLGLGSVYALLTRNRMNLPWSAAALAPAVLTFICVSAPGIIRLLPSGTLFRPGPGSHLTPLTQFLDFTAAWYFPPLTALAGGLLMWHLVRKGHQAAPAFVLILILSEVLLMNIQGILGRWITPYHFALFFIQPLLNTIIASLIATYYLRRRSRLLLSGAFAVLLLGEAVIGIQRVAGQESNEVALLRFLSKHTEKDAVIATMPFSKPFSGETATIGYMLLPYWVKAMSGRMSYSQFMSFAPDRERYVDRELTLGFLYSGKVQPLIGCPSVDSARVTANDLLTGASAFHQAQRLVDCSIMTERIALHTSCNLLSSDRIDYIIWQNEFDFEQPGWYSSFTRRVWQTQHGEYQVFAVDYRKLRAHLCQEHL